MNNSFTVAVVAMRIGLDQLLIVLYTAQRNVSNALQFTYFIASRVLSLLEILYKILKSTLK